MHLLKNLEFVTLIARNFEASQTTSNAIEEVKKQEDKSLIQAANSLE